ncbi:MAG TPA: hypothetical protein VFN49_11340 [Candidatus Aquilonibacter sp.]|nr:hypothetical protein [Candidatus Aquilonibacter sp.]
MKYRTSVCLGVFAALLFAFCVAPAVAGDDAAVSGTFTCTDAASHRGTWVFDGQGHVHVAYADGTAGDGTYRINAKTARPDVGFGGMMHIDAPGTQLDGFLAFRDGGFSLGFTDGTEFSCVPAH